MAKATLQTQSISDTSSSESSSNTPSITGLAALERLLKASADQLRLEIL